jgi:hypothetical protein
MLSPDPVTQAPENGQNYNRYSYAYNNPLKYTDPSGFTGTCVDSDYGFEYSCTGEPMFCRDGGCDGHLTDEEYNEWQNKRKFVETLIVLTSPWSPQTMTGDSRYLVFGAAGDRTDLKPTDEEFQLVEEGKLAEMWQSRCSRGDPIGCVGFATWATEDEIREYFGHRIADEYWISVGAGVRAAARSGLVAGNPGLLLDSAYMPLIELALGQDIARAHLSATNADLIGEHYFLDPRQITGYHHTVFDTYHIPRGFYGGSPITGEHWEILEIFYCIPTCDSY